MLVQRLVVNNSTPIEAVFNEVAAGSSLEIGLYFEDETAPGSGIYEPMSFDDVTFQSKVRAAPSDTAVLADLTVTPRAGEPGWVDFFLSAVDTLAIGERNVHWACKMIPDTAPERARVIVAGMIPIRWRATR